MANPNIAAVNNLYGGNAGWNLPASTTTTLITVDGGHIMKINTILCANVDGTNAANLSLYIAGMGSGTDGVTTTGADATIYIAKTITIPANSTLSLLDTPIYLLEDDELTGGTDNTNDLDLFISYEVIDVS